MLAGLESGDSEFTMQGVGYAQTDYVDVGLEKSRG